MKKKYKPEPVPAGKLNSPILTHMRKVAYEDLRIEVRKTMTKAERLRNDEYMLAAAEAKRLRKMEKAKK